MSDAAIPLVALIGAPRSGTTWLQNLLGADSRVVSPQETNLSRYVAPLHESWEWGLRGSGDDWAKRRYVGLASVVTGDEFRTLVSGFVEEALQRVIALKPGASVVVEKTPSHSLHVDLIARYAPQVRFVHIVRDGRDVAASLLDAGHGWGTSWGAPDTITRAATMWANHVNGARSAEGLAPYHEVRYEALRGDDGANELQRIFEFCGVPIDDEDARKRLDEFSLSRQKAEGTSSVVFGGEAVRSGSTGVEPEGFYGRGPGHWRDNWSVRDCVDFDAVAGLLLRELGYETDDGWLGDAREVARAQRALERAPARRGYCGASAAAWSERGTVTAAGPSPGDRVIVSHEHKFIFIKTRKTAGTSVERFLAPLLRDDAIVTPIVESGHPARNYQRRVRRYRSLLAGSHVWEMERDVKRDLWFFNHIGGRLIRARLGPRVWNSYFKFCFERDPWDKVVSYYHYRWANVPDGPTWEEFLFEGEMPVDFDKYSLDGRTIGVDFVGRFENLHDDLRHALDEAGLQGVELTLGREKGSYRPADAQVADAYDDAGLARVADVFHREIAAFGYTAPTLGPRSVP